METDASQDRIWSFFQNDVAGSAIFEGSRPRHLTLLRKIQRLAGRTTPNLLNIGIGDGNLERSANELGWQVSSLDPDAESVNKCVAVGIDAKAGSIDNIPFPDDQFDFVVVSEVLEHLSPEQRANGLREIRRALKPGGYLVGTVPYREILELNMTVCPKCSHVFHRWGHTTNFDLSKMHAELSRVFHDVSCRLTAFVEFKGRPWPGKLKSLVRLILARFGAAIAIPSILFFARKR